MFGRGNRGQGLSLAHTEFALLEGRLKMRGHVTHESHMAGCHHQGQQQISPARKSDHWPILMQFLAEIAIHHVALPVYNVTF